MTTLADRLSPTATRVASSTSRKVGERLRTRDDQRIAELAEGPPEALDARLASLDHEWDIERVLQANASTLALTALVLGRRLDRRFLALPPVVFTFLLQHALQGWCPPLPLFRRWGVRTAREIARERYALKALRGDFAEVP
ncbi:MAG TPA: hypothetical protein VFY20_11255, partial [Gemmatimonadales bacterium]|nr:hypothetical protein [Gemmatimonadales bacterium]